jgi:glycine hydroxymethyltransferase
MDILKQADPQVWQAIADERRRQQQGLEMIASENYTSPAVLAAQGSELGESKGDIYHFGGRMNVPLIGVSR